MLALGIFKTYAKRIYSVLDPAGDERAERTAMRRCSNSEYDEH